MSVVSETTTENIFRNFYKNNNFIEKSAIPKSYGFVSKNKTGNKGYPDFFLDDKERDFIIIVEAKALKHSDAEEVKWYMENNTINKTIVGIAVSGQEINQIKVSYYYKIRREKEIVKFQVKDKLLSIDNIETRIFIYLYTGKIIFMKIFDEEFFVNDELKIWNEITEEIIKKYDK